MTEGAGGGAETGDGEPPIRDLGKLLSVSIEGFRSFRRLTNFELRDVNVLIGANGSGKSNFLECFRALFPTEQHRIYGYRHKFDIDDLWRADPKRTKQFTVACQFHGFLIRQKHFPIDGFRELTHGMQLRDEYPFWAPGMLHWIHNSRYFERNIMMFRDLDVSHDGSIRREADLGTQEVLETTAGNLSAFLYGIKTRHPQSMREIVQQVRAVTPGFEGVEFQIHTSDSTNGRVVELRLRDDRVQTSLPLRAMSDGTLRFLALATILLQPEPPRIVLLDEPELGLHPYAQTVLAELIRAVSHRVQVILATQSTTLVNQFPPEEVVVCDKVDGETKMRRLDGEALAAWLDDYGVGDLWEKNVIGGRP